VLAVANGEFLHNSISASKKGSNMAVQNFVLL